MNWGMAIGVVATFALFCGFMALGVLSQEARIEFCKERGYVLSRDQSAAPAGYVVCIEVVNEELHQRIVGEHYTGILNAFYGGQ